MAAVLGELPPAHANWNATLAAVIVDTRFDNNVIASIFNALQHLPAETTIWFLTSVANHQASLTCVRDGAIALRDKAKKKQHDTQTLCAEV